MTGTEIYKRTSTYEAQARSIRLHAPQWKLLLAFDGVRSLAEAALSADTAFADAVPLTQKFLDSKWIAEEPISLDQYLKRAGAKDISSTGAMVPPAVILHEPEKPKPVAPPTPLPPPPASASVAAPVPPPPLPASTATAAVPVSALPTTDRPPMKRSMKLSSVVDYITSLVGNVALGQVLVYRVFLRVPPELLLSEDIASVHLSGDTSLINTEKLQRAIGDAFHAVTKKSLPDSVYAAA